MKRHQFLLVFVAFFGLTALAQTSKNAVTKDFSVSTGESGGNLKITVELVEGELNKEEKAAVEMFAFVLAGSRKAGGLVNKILVENLLNGLAETAKNNIDTIRGLNGPNDKQGQNPKLQLPILDSKTKTKRI